MFPYERRREYYELLVHNKITKLHKTITEASLEDRKYLLNGHFDFHAVISVPCPVVERMSRPLLVAVMIGSSEEVDLLIKEGADVFQENSLKENIFHSLIAASSLEILTEEKAAFLFLQLLRLLREEDIKKLLFQENSEGLRPLEMAAKLGCVLLYEAIQLTPKVYVSKTIHIGMTKEEWIDITEYESYEPGNRRRKAPLTMVAHLDKNIAFENKHGDILKCDIVTMWTSKKVCSLQAVLMNFTFMCVLLFCSFSVLVSKGSNIHNKRAENNMSTPVSDCQYQTLYFVLPLGTDKLLAALILAFCCINMIIIIPRQYFAFFKHYKIYCKNLSSTKELFSHNVVFLVLIFVLCTLNLMFAVLIILDTPEYEMFLNVLIVAISPIACSGILFSLRLSPRLGHFTIAVKEMVSVLSQFTVLFLIIYLPFVHSFYRMLQGKDGCGNPKFSSSVAEHYYNTFIITLNMIDFTQFQQEIRNYNLLLLLHIIFVFLVSILLLNFLIALLSTVVAEVMENKKLILLVQTLNEIFLLELVMEQWQLHRKIAQYFQRKHFLIKDNRFYLRKISHTKSNCCSFDG